MKAATYTLDDSIAAIASALAPSALAIVRTSGKKSIENIAKIFSRPKALLKATGNTMLYGYLVDATKKIDEVVLCIYRAPKSFTGENAVEIICHGGTAVVAAVFTLLVTHGFRAAERGEFSFRSFINGKMDLTKAEAVCEIINAKTDYSRNLAVGRLAGNLFNEIEAIKQDIIFALATATVEVEYPEDEQTIADGFDGERLNVAYERISLLCRGWSAEKCYREGVRIVLAGRTNAGKSALFNALLKEERAIVSDIHGTTRDWIEAGINIHGIPALLYDIAGFRETEDLIENVGLERARSLLEHADLILYLLPANENITAPDIDFLNTPRKCPLISVRSKIDCSEKMWGPVVSAVATCAVSAKNGTGMDVLIDTMFAVLTANNHPERTTENSLAPGTERQKRALFQARDAVKATLQALQQGFSADTIIPDLENAIEYLGEITGEVRPDDILSCVFANFCVGK